MSITIPQTIEDAKKRLGQLEKAERLAGWERAAIVWAHTRELVSGQHSPSPSGEGGRKAAAEALGISTRTIDRDRANWKWAMENVNAPDVKPGDVELTLPTVKYPPTEESGARGERGMRETLSNPERAKEALQDPRVRRVLAEAIADDPKAEREVDKAVYQARIKRHDLGKPKSEPIEEPLIPNSVLRKIANTALELKRELEVLLDMAEQHPEVIDLVRRTSNMGGSPDYFRYGIDELAPVLEKTQDVFGQYIASEAAKRVNA